MEFTKTIHVRTFSDSLSRTLSSDSDHHSPISVLHPITNRRRSSRRRSVSKSLTLTELELEELKGFKDLGYEFSEEDQKDPSLVSIIPGLRRLVAMKEDHEEDVVVERPYLSEAWEIMEKNEAIPERTSLIYQRIREMGSDQNGMLMKEQLKLWVHSVASEIR